MRALISLALISGCGSSPPSVDCSRLASEGFAKAADHDFWTCEAAR
ncbi:MAG: hypothetical protein ABI467_20110 [Kofleriaceae bacterium]